MACYYPITGWRSIEKTAKGKRKIVFNKTLGYSDMEVQVPCGKCIGCKLERSRQWAIRCMHENTLHEKSCFVTLTYNDENLPPNGTLVLEHFQLFMKRLRKKFSPQKIRFFHCGEYGAKLSRPHYHAILWGVDFSDKVLREVTDKGSKLYVSNTLNDLWENQGFTTIGEVTFESCAYVARYVTKKINGEKAFSHYSDMDLQTGELFEKKPEYITMSRRKGIGYDFYTKYYDDIYPNDICVIRGKVLRPPKAYDRYLEVEHPTDFATIKHKRRRNAEEKKMDNTVDRLAVKEKIKLINYNSLKRSYEHEV